MEKKNLPIVCDLSVFNETERKQHETTSLEVIKHARRITELNDGYALHHDYDENNFVETAKWITRENRCCPFFTFELVIEPFATGREMIIRLRGNIEAKQILRTGLEKMKIQSTQ